MTDRCLYSKLHDILLPLESKVSGSISTFKTQQRSGSYMSHKTTNPLVVNVNWFIEDARVVKQLKELERGDINIVWLSCLGFDEIVHVQNIRVKEVGGRIDQWMVQGEFNLVGDVWQWVIDGQEIITDWDTIADVVFLADGTSCNSGGTMVDEDGNTWQANQGDWTQHNSGGYLYADIVSGRPSIFIDLIYQANVTIQVKCYLGSNIQSGLMMRAQNTTTTSIPDSYTFVIDPVTNTAWIRKWISGVETKLKTWNSYSDGTAFSFSLTTYYTARVICSGNRFDCYIDGKYIDTVYDETYKAGMFGVFTYSASARFDDFTLEHVKPVVIHLPVGAYDYNQIRMPITSRLNDDVNADGLSRMIIAPDNPVTFKQLIPILSDPSGGEVKIWDTMGEDGLWDYLEFHAKLDEGTGLHVYDSSKHNRAVTENSWATADWSTSSYNNGAKTCYHFDGANDYFDLGTNPDISSNCTFACWFKTDNVAVNQIIFDGRDAITDGILIWFSNTGAKINTYYNTVNVTDGTALIADTWYFLTVVINKSTDILQMYLNGETYGTAGNIAGQTIEITAPICIGSTSYGAASGWWDGYMDDIIVFSTALSADRIKWLYENMPNMVDESQWVRRYDIRDDFVGDMIVDNRLIRLSQGYRNTYLHSNFSQSMPKIWGYSDGMWEDNFTYRWFWHTTSAGYMTTFDSLIIKDIQKYKVVLETKAVGTGPYYIDHEIYITTGQPLVMFKATDWLFNANPEAYVCVSKSYIGNNIPLGYDQGCRFGSPSLDNMYDNAIESGFTNGNETEGLSIGFSTQQNLLVMGFWQTDTDWRVYSQAVLETIGSFANIGAIDFVTDPPPYHWAVGLMPFDTSLLNSNSWSDSVLSGVESGAITINDYPAGSYRAYVYATGANSDENATFIITGAVGTSGIFTWTTISSSGEWSDPIDFIADKLDDITYTITRTGGTGDITLGELVIVPIANSKNFPLDVRNEALMMTNITELGGKL